MGNHSTLQKARKSPSEETLHGALCRKLMRREPCLAISYLEQNR